ncbi:hypothetical protein [Stieleria varia]|uniref:Uncharacterized protein n=1 Tax=Stieleria varia TaxID=2528005 RepID=A0A5C5ZY47_9BACT|nr:hypothetical protein [Stieleria varia]TWT92090.1 hypothetical protein Pla52n_63870 [Stieleria varia]
MNLKRFSLAGVIMTGCLLTAFAWAQDRSGFGPVPSGRGSAGLDADLDADIPRAALLTDKGMQLAARLRMLRDSESRMGSKHPSLPDVQRQIAEIRVQLRDWANEPAKEGVLPRKREPLSNEELQQIVIRLAEEVDVLKQKVGRLESR